MAAFWWEIMRVGSALPSKIIFFTWPRLQTTGLHWAPASFRNLGNFGSLKREITEGESARVMPQGLSVRLPGIELHAKQATPLHTDGGKWASLLPISGRVADPDPFVLQDLEQTGGIISLLLDVESTEMQRYHPAKGLLGTTSPGNSSESEQGEPTALKFNMIRNADLLLWDDYHTHLLETLYRYSDVIYSLVLDSPFDIDGTDYPLVIKASRFYGHASGEITRRIRKQNVDSSE
ncbi:hypothetical protein LTR62_003385 [Meristemomyces frigidus]|uniref:Uncharacterized protein n=1 Tax=Meristemomyces frigidus TaxID=1508187 RepID=A0AAN7TKT6_9PEZI|nr:hypothetical protein LTR62_003385 [Meristemomyces frigidus]